MPNKSNIGGQSAAQGIHYQARVGAWFASRLLAEEAAPALFQLAAGTLICSVSCEAGSDVDDIVVGTSAGGVLYCQAKSGPVDLSRREDSPLGKALEQFVRQYLAVGARQTGTRPGQRPIDPMKDRFVLVVDQGAAGTVRDSARIVIERLQASANSQPIDWSHLAHNESERNALQVLREHIENFWKAQTTNAPDDEQVQALLKLVHILVVQVGNDDREAREARTLVLAQLRNAADEQSAWAEIVEHFITLQTKGGGVDRYDVVQLLESRGKHLKTTPSFLADVEEIRRRSASTLAKLERHTSIVGSAGTISVDRPVVASIRGGWRSGGVVVVGRAGSGKSGALVELAKREIAAGTDVVMLAAEDFTDVSPGCIRGEIGLQHDLLDVLRNWPGPDAGLLIVDALDAMRNVSMARVVASLLRPIAELPRWRVVASVREFDLTQSPDLSSVFRGVPPAREFSSPAFQRIRHVLVPELSNDELRDIEQRDHRLAGLFAIAGQALTDLIKIPFNMRLAADLLLDGVEVAKIAESTGHLELLDLYWRHRVGPHSPSERALRGFVDILLARRALNATRVECSQLDLLAVLTNSVLVVSGRGSAEGLQFAHHILFDYAVAILKLAVPPNDIVQLLAADRQLAVAVIPSLRMHFESVWHQDPTRNEFWNLVGVVHRSPGVPEVAKLVGAAIVADLVKQPQDLEQVLGPMVLRGTRAQTEAAEVIRHLVGAVLSVGSRRVAGPDAGPWAYAASHLACLAATPDDPSLEDVRLLLIRLGEFVDQLTTEQLEQCGRAARVLLTRLWERSGSQYSRAAVRQGIVAVARTYASDAQASRTILEQVFNPPRMAEHCDNEVPALAWEMKRLIRADPEFAALVYACAFGHPPPSADAKTALGSSQILSLISNRKQDFEGSWYSLQSAFSEFLTLSPALATQALIAAVAGYVDREHSRASSKSAAVEFQFMGVCAKVAPDHSHIWNAGDSYHEPVLEMLDELDSHLAELIEAHDTGTADLILAQVAKLNQLAVVWRRVLRAVADHPQALLTHAVELASHTALMRCLDTQYELGRVLEVTFPLMDPEQKALIESTVLKLADDSEREAGLRDRMLAAIAPAGLVSEPARALARALDSDDPDLKNRPAFTIGGWEPVPFDQTAWLREQGIAVDEPANRELLDAAKPLRAWWSQFTNAVPTPEACAEVLCQLRGLHQLWTSSATSPAADPRQRDDSMSVAAAVAALCVECRELTPNDRETVTRILLDAASTQTPKFSQQMEEQFETSPSWGSPSGRIEAARGLAELALRDPTSDLTSALWTLWRDPVAAVRFQLAVRLAAFLHWRPVLGWALLESGIAEENNRGVVTTLAASALPAAANHAEDRGYEFAIALLKRFPCRPDDRAQQEVRRACVGFLTDLWLFRGSPGAQQYVTLLVNDPLSEPDATKTTILRACQYLVLDEQVAPTAATDRAWEIFVGTTNQLGQEMAALRREFGENSARWQKDALAAGRNIVDLGHELASRLYFATEPLEERKGYAPLSVDDKRLLLERGGPLVPVLAELPAARIAHELSEFVASLVPVAPKSVFLLMREVVNQGVKYNLNFEELALKVVVAFVNRYLAEHRDLLANDRECLDALLQILDHFVRAGWPDARQLTYRLGEIFR